MLAGAAVLLNFEPALACTTREKMYLTAMKSDLRVFSQAQTEYFAKHGRYAADRALLDLGRPSVGMKPLRILAADERGVSASLMHTELGEMTCFIFLGVPAPMLAPKGGADEPWCEGEWPDWVPREISYGTAQALVLSMVVLTLVTGVFLRRPGRLNWPFVALGVISFFALANLVATFCRRPLSTGVILTALGFTVFGYALRTRIVARGA